MENQLVAYCKTKKFRHRYLFFVAEINGETIIISNLLWDDIVERRFEEGIAQLKMPDNGTIYEFMMINNEISDPNKYIDTEEKDCDPHPFKCNLIQRLCDVMNSKILDWEIHITKNLCFGDRSAIHFVGNDLTLLLTHPYQNHLDGSDIDAKDYVSIPYMFLIGDLTPLLDLGCVANDDSYHIACLNGYKISTSVLSSTKSAMKK